MNDARLDELTRHLCARLREASNGTGDLFVREIGNEIVWIGSDGDVEVEVVYITLTPGKVVRQGTP